MTEHKKISPIVSASSGQNDVLLDIRDLTVEFWTELGIKQAINHLNLTIRRGEALGLVGEAGAGKTTTALAILRLLQPKVGRVISGSIIYNGVDMATYSEKQMQNLRGNKISMIFQNPLTSLNPVFTVGEQLALVLRKHQHMKNKEAFEEAGKLMEMVGIRADRIKDFPHQFSGGMRQRIGIAAALACNPELLIADEPKVMRDLGQFMEHYDILISPTMGIMPLEAGFYNPFSRPEMPVHDWVLERRRWSGNTAMCNVTGQPSITVPLEWSKEGLPIGIEIDGRVGEDALVLQLSAQLERAKPWAGCHPEIYAGR